MRKIEKNYEDPLDLVWIHAAKTLGITIVRDSEVFAAWDGKSILRIGTPETLDDDDCLAQMVFHEFCHAMIEGPTKFHEPDWGLDMDESDHIVHEHAALRLQAGLSDRYQLREFFASTTDFRSYFDRLSARPLEGEGDPAAAMANAAWARATTGQWGSTIDDALKRTKRILCVIQDLVDEDSLWHTRKSSH